jgi:hypothetical protein
MTNKNALVPARKSNKTVLGLLRDRRGGELVQSLIILMCVAIAGITAFKALGGKISGKANEAAGKVDTIK